MLPPSVARALRERGHDVEAVVERPNLRTRPDLAILAAAQSEGRVVVTEDSGDFLRRAIAEAAAGRPHPSLVLTSNRRFPRGNPRTEGRLVTALDALLASGAEVEGEHWLQPPD